MPSLPRRFVPGLLTTIVLISACDSTPEGTLSQCAPEDATHVLPLGEPQQEVLSTEDCLIDSFRAVGWRLPIGTRARVQIDLTSNDFNPLMLVTDSELALIGIDDDSGEGSSSLLLRELAPDEYFVWVMSIFRGQTGAFQLSAHEVEGALCEELVGELDLPDDVSGSLTTASCILGDGSFADPWLLTVSPGTTVRITLGSEDFESFLFVTDEEGDEVFGDGDGLSSQLVAELDGTYTVWATTLDSGAVGSYELSVEDVGGGGQ